jgi:hypothetical protein
LSRVVIFLAISAILCATEIAPSHTPRFSDYPFDQWAAAPEHSGIKWEIRLPPAQLSVHQRLVQRIQTVVPGGELAKRRGRGEMVLLARFEDSDGRQWRTGSRIDLAKVQEGVKSQELTFTTAAFVRPGDYKVSLALLDTQTMEHSFTRRMLHVVPIKGDPLPDAWNGLPAVEVLPPVDGPDAWFLPGVKSLLHLPLHDLSLHGGVDTEQTGELRTNPTIQTVAYTGTNTRAPVRHSVSIDLLVNTTPSQWTQNPAGNLRRNMSVVIPALKVLSALNAKVHPPSAAVLDLTHHRVGFETANAASLDWDSMNQLFAQTNPSVIDAKSLAAQSSIRNYFAKEVARRAGESGPERWLIVLSGPLVFAKQDEMSLPELAPDPRRHIIYLRFSSGPGFVPPEIEIGPVKRVHGPMPGLGTVIPFPPGRGRGGGGRGEPGAGFPDDIERMLKPMGAQIVSITNPEVFRKTVASLIEEISAAD